MKSVLYPIAISMPTFSFDRSIGSLAFACTTTMTVPLSASLAAKTTSNSPASRNARARKFQLLNMLSTVLAILLLLPPVIMAASPRTPVSESDR